MLGKDSTFMSHPSYFLVYIYVLFQGMIIQLWWKKVKENGQIMITNLSFWASFKVTLSETTGLVAKDSEMWLSCSNDAFLSLL